MARTASEAAEIVELHRGWGPIRPAKDFPGHDKPVKRFTFGDALTTLLTGWGAMSRILEIKFERWPKHQGMLYVALAEITWSLSKPSSSDGYGAMQFEPPGPDGNEKIVTHDQASRT